MVFLFPFKEGNDYKGIDIQLFFQGVHGNQIYNALRYRTEGAGLESTLSTTMNDVWRATATDASGNVTESAGSIPNPQSTTNFKASSRFVEDGSYLRLKTAQIGYTLPSKMMKKIGITRCRFYVSGSNLLTFTKYSGYDPEVGSGVDYGNYPQSRTILVGTNINF